MKKFRSLPVPEHRFSIPLDIGSSNHGRKSSNLGFVSNYKLQSSSGPSRSWQMTSKSLSYVIAEYIYTWSLKIELDTSNA
ncbi:unnamed protein product [Diplocarpon coronariae]